MNFFKDRRVLCVFAHPDDEVLGCGGTIAMHRPRMAALTFAWAAIPAVMLPEVNLALKQLGVEPSQPRPTGGPDTSDQEFDAVPQLKWNQYIERAIEESNPDLIFTHHPGDSNKDHRIVCEAVQIATRAINGQKIDVLMCEIPSGTGPRGFDPNFYVKMTNVALNCKTDAMEAYVSQMRKPPHPRHPRALSDLCRLRGSECGSIFAEAFMVHRMYQ